MEDYLQHHGIIGQRWGKRNGPPYPLDGDKSSSISKGSKPSEGYKPKTPDMQNRENSKYEKEIKKIPESLIKKWSKHDVKQYCKYREKGYSKEESIHQIQIDQKTRKRIIIASSVAAAVVLGYIAYKKIDSGEVDALIERGKLWLNGKDVSFDNSFKKLNPLEKDDSTVDSIFHNFADKINPDYGKAGTTNNCRRCTFAFEMRRRGYDVVATKSIDGTGQTDLGLASAIDVKKNYSIFNALTEKQIEKVQDVIGDRSGFFPKRIFESEGLGKYPNGARGELILNWVTGGGHSMAWEIVDNKPVIFDCQTHKVYRNALDFSEFTSHIMSVSAKRLDNLELDPGFLLRWMKNA